MLALPLSSLMSFSLLADCSFGFVVLIGEGSKTFQHLRWRGVLVGFALLPSSLFSALPLFCCFMMSSRACTRLLISFVFLLSFGCDSVVCFGGMCLCQQLQYHCILSGV